MSTQVSDKPKMKFRILAGRHTARDPKDPRKSVLFSADPNDPLPNLGPIIETEADLEKAFNTTISRKFERVHDAQTPAPVMIDPLVRGSGESQTAYAKRLGELATKAREQASAALPQPAQLEKMTLKELQDFADGEEIDLGPVKTKDEALKALRRALVPAAV